MRARVVHALVRGAHVAVAALGVRCAATGDGGVRARVVHALVRGAHVAVAALIVCCTAICDGRSNALRVLANVRGAKQTVVALRVGGTRVERLDTGDVVRIEGEAALVASRGALVHRRARDAGVVQPQRVAELVDRGVLEVDFVGAGHRAGNERRGPVPEDDVRLDDFGADHPCIRGCTNRRRGSLCVPEEDQVRTVVAQGRARARSQVFETERRPRLIGPSVGAKPEGRDRLGIGHVQVGRIDAVVHDVDSPLVRAGPRRSLRSGKAKRNERREPEPGEAIHRERLSACRTPSRSNP